MIEDLLQEEYQKDAAFDKWANIGDETMFVKNLENVQGDERDVILFSIAFGPDAEGKLSLNFGPLNKNGGWKRLNVAVSRARAEMVVFTTMTADMIDLKRTKSKGVEALKDFLEFAQKGRLNGEYVETRVQKDQGIMEHICQAITDGGYKYQKAVGHSKFKIDIAVINPYNEEEYLLGVMLDGESYRQSTNTKDREVAQIGVLNGLGWKLHRIWTMDWWDNRDKELAKLMQILEEKKEAAHQIYLEQCIDDLAEEKSVSESVISEDDTEEYSMPQNPFLIAADVKAASGQGEAKGFIAQMDPRKMEYRVENYVSADVEVTELSTTDYVKKESMMLISDKMQQILDAEAPITYERLVKKTLRAFNIARSSTQTLEATDKALKKVSARLSKQSGVKFFWRKDQDPDQYRIYRNDVNSGDKRSVDEICQQELKNAICVTLMEQGALDKDSLLKAVIRTMGYARSSTALAAAAERGLKYGRKTEEIIQDAEKRFVLSDSQDILSEA